MSVEAEVAKIGATLDANERTMYRVEKVLNHLEMRVRSLEQSRAWILGAAAALGALSGWLARKLGI